MRRVSLILEKLLHTHNMSVSITELFLRSYEVSQFALKAVTTRIFYPIGSLATVILEKSLLAYKKSRHFFGMCRMILIQSALCFPNPGEAFTYSQHV